MKAFTFAAVLCCVLSVGLGGLISKQLAGPASEFEARALPKPSVGALVDSSAMFRANFAKHAKKNQLAADSDVVYTQQLLVDSTTKFIFSFFSPYDKDLKLDLVDANGQTVNLHRHAIKDHFPIGTHSFPGTTYIFDTPVVGQWTLTVRQITNMNLHQFIQLINKGKTANQLYDAIILQWNDSPFQMYTHLNTYNLQAGQKIGLVTTITEEGSYSRLGARASKNITSISVAEMDMVKPDGVEIDVNMQDDGLAFDGVANDGTYGAFVVADEVGNYAVQAIVKGVRNDGVEFIRSTQHIIAVTSADLDLVGTATGAMTNSAANRMNINVAVTTPAEFPHLNPKFRTYAEVWAKDANNNDVPVCWVSNIGTVHQDENGQYVTVELDLKWLALVNAVAPITLKNVYVQDAYTMIPVADFATIPVTTTTEHVTRALRMIGRVNEISLEMKQGVMPFHILSMMNSTGAEDGTVVLVHGYCAGSNPWAAKPEQWTNAAFFSNPNANLANQDFAEAVYDFTQKNNIKRFSLVGHSQGGIVGTHLLNYYFTGMDATTTGRRVQSIGTPYQGCGGAGSAANLVKTFGYGCGENYDLTHDGSTVWLTGISAETAKSVYYYTTTYQQGKLFGDYCNLAVNLVLKWPNDGTTELQFAPLPGANDMGNKQKWCHTTDMGYPAQYTDAARNSEMNANAAR